MGVVPTLDEVEDRQLGLSDGVPTETVDQFALQRRKEAIAQSVVITVPDRALGRTDASQPAVFSELDGRLLTTLVKN